MRIKNFFKKLFINYLTNDEKDSIIDKLNEAWPVGQAVKTLASHAENMGSIPVRVTNEKKQTLRSGCLFLFVCAPHKLEPTLKICDFQDMGSHTKRSHRRAFSPVASAGIFSSAEIPVFIKALRSGCLFLFVCAPHKLEPTCAFFVCGFLKNNVSRKEFVYRTAKRLRYCGSAEIYREICADLEIISTLSAAHRIPRPPMCRATSPGYTRLVLLFLVRD